jgi:hypothetical protein
MPEQGARAISEGTEKVLMVLCRACGVLSEQCMPDIHIGRLAFPDWHFGQQEREFVRNRVDEAARQSSAKQKLFIHERTSTVAADRQFRVDLRF